MRRNAHAGRRRAKSRAFSSVNVVHPSRGISAAFVTEFSSSLDVIRPHFPEGVPDKPPFFGESTLIFIDADRPGSAVPSRACLVRWNSVPMCPISSFSLRGPGSAFGSTLPVAVLVRRLCSHSCCAAPPQARQLPTVQCRRIQRVIRRCSVVSA